MAGAPAVATAVLPQRRRVAANTASLVFAYAIPRAFTLLSAVVAARVLGAALFGDYATAAAVAVVASIVATLGMQPLLVREVARAPRSAPRLIAAAHAAKLGTVALMGSVLVAVAVLALRPPVAAAALLLGAGYAVGAFVENLAAYFQGIERMHVWTQASAILGVVSGGAGVALVMATRSLLWLCAAPLLGQSAALAWLLRSAPAAVRRPPVPAAATVVALLRRLAPFAVAFIATTLFYRADVLLLSHWRASAEVGTYSAAYRFLDVAQALAAAAAGALLPQLSRRGQACGTLAPRLIAWIAAGTAPVACLLFALRQPVVSVLYGPGYAAAVPVLAILAPVVVPVAVNMFALCALNAMNAMWVGAALYVGAAALNVALNLAWIPGRGAHGAALAALITESALAIGFACALRLRRAR
ncbi:MAG TPA: oligosaccharide flippase family protein [Longimicrobiaceae bacterium]|nr:oligosaccharide flippase family protein [Longimicrobiaceae bacterium]